MAPRVISGKEDSHQDPYQLTIIVKDTKDFTAYELVKTVATSVASFVPVWQEASERGKNWEEWLNGRFRKLVKRLKPSLFNKLAVQLQNDNIEYLISTGKIDLIVLAPQRKSFAPSYLKRAQLSGLSTVEGILPTTISPESTISVLLDNSLSVSKAAVSAAHALQVAKQSIYDENGFDNFDSLLKNVDFVWKDLSDGTEYTLDIVDAGLTEVDPGTRTAAVLLR